MMVLVGFSVTQTLLGVLIVSLGLLVLIIAYKKLLAYLGKGSIIKEDYCVLYPLESNPISGEAEFYFTTEKNRNIIFELLKNILLVDISFVLIPIYSLMDSIFIVCALKIRRP